MRSEVPKGEKAMNEPNPLSAIGKVMIFLDTHKGWYTVAHLAKELNMPRSSVQKALTSLRNANKVERDLGDGNGYLWYA
jgi:DNA-binding IclR family transcriptional regulator